MLKKIVKTVVPSFALPLVKKWYIAYAYYRERLLLKSFDSWWNTFRVASELPKELIGMIDNFVTSPDYHKLTDYWHYLNKQNITQIATDGLANYRQTVSKNYYTWVGLSLENGYTNNLIKKAQVSSEQIPLSQILKKHDLFTLDQSVQHNLVTVMLYEYVMSTGGGRHAQNA